MLSRIAISALLFVFAFNAEARIRLRKVKEAPKTCQTLKEDPLLSRPDKKVLSTERHSLIFEDGINLVRDKGEKICSWRLSEFDSFAPMEQFQFFIDEYKEILYSYVKNADQSYFIMTIPFATCSLDTKVTLPEFQPPKCEKPKKKSSAKKRKKKK
jgi:hypothetical protein